MEDEVRVLTIGTFDTPHLGHARLFQRCEELGELTVGVNSDRFVEQYKGKRPLFTEEERIELISELGYRAVINDDSGRSLILAISPDYLAIGSDWAGKDYHKQIDVTQEELDAQDTKLVYLPYTRGISTTEIKRRIADEA